MTFRFNNYSIKTKVLIPTSIILLAFFVTYTIVFSRLYMSVKSDAFNDHNVLSQLNEQIYNIRLEGDNVSKTQLTALSELASNFLSLALSTDNKEEIEEISSAQLINKNTLSYIQAYEVWLPKHSTSEHHTIPRELLTLEKALIASINTAKKIVQEQANEDLDSLLKYEIISSIIIYLIILAYVGYGSNLLTLPLIRLRGKINKFNNYPQDSKDNNPSRDEITLLKDSFYIMRADIINKQALLEKALAEAKLANTVKTEFLANISHELRTPMLGILGFAELGISKVDDVDKSKLLKYFSRIHSSGSRLLLLLNNLLDLSKLDANQMDFNIQENNLKEVVNFTHNELTPLINSKHLEVSIQALCQNFIAEFDKEKVHQVIYNLLANAIKFSPNNSVITITFEDDTILINNHKLPAIKFTIADQGIGIPDAELQSIFEKFSQSSRTKTGAGGTGLGLSICNDICQYHKGKLWASNLPPPKHGAIFTLVLPRISVTPHR